MLKRGPPWNISRKRSRKQPPMGIATRQRKHVMAGLRAISGEQKLLKHPRAPLGQVCSVPSTAQVDRKRCQRTFLAFC